MRENQVPLCTCGCRPVRQADPGESKQRLPLALAGLRRVVGVARKWGQEKGDPPVISRLSVEWSS